MIGFLRLPEAPLPSRPINIDATTSPGRLVVRAMFAINRLTIPAAALMAVQQASQAAVPIAMGLAIDRALAANDRGALVLWLVLLVGLYGVLAVAYRLAFGWRSWRCSSSATRCACGSPTRSSTPVASRANCPAWR